MLFYGSQQSVKPVDQLQEFYGVIQRHDSELSFVSQQDCRNIEEKIAILFSPLGKSCGKGYIFLLLLLLLRG